MTIFALTAFQISKIVRAVDNQRNKIIAKYHLSFYDANISTLKYNNKKAAK